MSIKEDMPAKQVNALVIAVGAAVVLMIKRGKITSQEGSALIDAMESVAFTAAMKEASTDDDKGVDWNGIMSEEFDLVLETYS